MEYNLRVQPAVEQLRLEAKLERLKDAKQRAKEYWDPLSTLEKQAQHVAAHPKLARSASEASPIT
jgi:hypothetical protein